MDAVLPPHNAQIRRMGCALQPIPNAALPLRTKPQPGDGIRSGDPGGYQSVRWLEQTRPRLAYLGKKTYATCCGWIGSELRNPCSGRGDTTPFLSTLKRFPLRTWFSP